MPLTPAQLTAAKLGAGRTYIGTSATRDALARRFGAGSLVNQGGKTYFKGAFGAPPATAPGPTTPTDSTAAPTPTDPTDAFINALKGLLPKQATPVTPFDQTGFYNEADARAAVDQEYDPYYAKQKAYQDAVNAGQDRQTAESVNAAGGFRSSAYQNELEMRRQALQRAAEEQTNQQKAQKETSLLSRRNEAYQRYLQSIGAVAA